MLPPAVPASLTPLVGRETEISTLSRLLEEARLVTLTGAGGSGKTRLAAEVATLAGSKFAHGVAWVELAPLNDPALLLTYVLDALRLEHGARPPIDTLIDALRGKHLLLVFDNCEHLVEACALLAERLLQGCERLQVLATSREALGVNGERAWLVPGLPDAPAVRLFIDRAQAASASFRLTEANAKSVAQICRRLDGLPLAIELAAARVRTLTPDELSKRLDDAFQVLTSGARTAVPRHRTLREAIEWSYNLLDDRERGLLQRLSTFAGDFTLHAAESVAADVDLDPADVLDTIAALVDKSLVVMREDEGTARFTLLETIRQYASAKLKESGAFPRVCGRHAQTYMTLAEEAAPHLITRDRPQWVQRIQRELDNIRVALACTREDDVAAHLRFLGNLGWFWYSSGLWTEGRRWFEGAIALAAPDARQDRARVLFGAGVLASLQGDTPAAVKWLEESASIFDEVDDRTGEAYALAYQGVAWGLVADDRAEAPTEKALAFFRKSGDLYGLRLSLVVLSTLNAVTKRPELALKYGEEGAEVARAYGLDRELAIALQVLGQVHLASGDLHRARELYRECIAALRRDPSLFWIARALRLLALAHFRLGANEHGAFLMGASEAARESIGAGLIGHDRALLLPAMDAARDAIGATAFDAAMTGGRSAPLDTVLDRVVRESDTGEFPVPKAPARKPMSHPPLEVRALGPLEILRDGKPVPDDSWRYAKPRELLLYLLSHPEGSTREQIGLVFWPDASATQVKNSFHVTLHHMRKALGRADLIAFERDRYRIAWELGVTFDAREFEQRARAGLRSKTIENSDLKSAVAVYRGEFLAGANAGDWHLETRDALRRLYLDAVMRLGQESMERALYKEGADWFRRAVSADALHEEAHRRLMLALSRGGERSEALRQYERLAQVLNQDMEAQPDRETKSLYEKLKRAEPV